MRLALVLVLACSACVAEAVDVPLIRDADVTWRDPAPDFGGFSGLALDADGLGFTTVSDRGTWARGRLERDAAGSITGVTTLARGPLRAISGEILTSPDTDAEAIVFDADGSAYVTFENFHRIRRFDDLDGAAANVPAHPDFRKLQRNSGLEALAMDADGTLYAIPERSGHLERPFPVYRLRGGVWDKQLRIPREPPFLVADATFGPDGRLYLLERDFEWLGGFRSRVRRFALGPDGLGPGETLLETRYGELDNMEGIAVWRDQAGRLRLLLLSDDNFFPLQRTEFVEYIIDELR